MTLFAAGEWIGHFLLGGALFLLSTFLILLIMVQKGKGGGLTGALGGMGGQSAFGTKAGDVFTKVTAGTAIAWIALCTITMVALGDPPATANDQEVEREADEGDDNTSISGTGDDDDSN